jgi:hypothetical protein
LGYHLARSHKEFPRRFQLSACSSSGPGYR